MSWPVLERLRALSLRRALLLLLVPGFLLVGAAEVWQTWRTAVDAANAAYDRSLLGAIKAMDANISTASGGLAVELPYRMLEFFELTASGHVYFRVATENGLVEIGSSDLPRPSGVLVTGQPVFRDAVYFDEAVRVGSYARVLDKPLGGQVAGQRLLIQVAETLESRQAFTRELVLQSVARDVLLMVVAVGLMVLAVSWALRPLARLRREVQARAPQDLRPIDVLSIPAEVQPLVDAINFHIERNRQHTEARQRFVDDASHQLRTPLTTLTTQVGFALREADPDRQREVLVAIKNQLEETIRQTNQMLALARVDSAEFVLEVLDATAIAEKVTRDWWPQARASGVDLGFEPDNQPLLLNVHGPLLQEALSNLLHNAIRYTPRGGQVTVKLRHSADRGMINVLDSGPGMSADDLNRAGNRFFRGSNVTQPGSGLGLAIVRSIAIRMNGEFRLSANADGPGLVASIVLPLVQNIG
ncbi:sensor histidine kinase N-terminal domain-containing protein [Rhodoferax sp.]|uniref:sensor histidine kinase n=1 Tax=Rhodoferax sp. TaxID=50421 RepID=UPI0028504F13|nr:sensor histidine kinase N-terminal domain-containing protein [Rhodoferax sp.]MDR3368337.1 sensor histidine kinase N-terminal domain-containing protein [Rhodoferax sp.]